MRRWNGWGDEAVALAVPAAARQLLVDLVGTGTPPRDADLGTVVSAVRESRLSGWSGLLTDPLVRILHARGQSFPDWVALRLGEVGETPDAVAYPETSVDASKIIAVARASGARLIPYGGGTSVVGHVNPPSDGPPVVTVDMRRMNACQSVDSKSGLAVFGSGIVGPNLEARLRAEGFTLGHFPQSFEYSTLGGWVATRSSGQESLGYGRIERLFAGGKVESPSGPLVLPAFPASAAGPDLREMLLGSEGRLGFLTECTVRVTRLPECEEVHGFLLPDWEVGTDAVRSILQCGLRPSMLRLSSPEESRTLFALSGHSGLLSYLSPLLRIRGIGAKSCFLLVGFKGNRHLVSHVREEVFSVLRAFGGVSLGQRPGRSWRRSRFATPYLRNSLWELGYGVDTLETACSWSALPRLVRSIEDGIRSAFGDASERCHVFTHLSHPYTDGSSLYTTLIFRLAPDPRETLQTWCRAKEAASRAIAAGGGTISHHHGVGRDHRDHLEAEKGPLGVAALRAVAKSLDPDGLMNPGKLVT